MSPFTTIVADPPWQYNDKMMSGNSKKNRKNSRGAANHYSTMTVDEIKKLGYTCNHIAGYPIAENAHLYMWVTNSFMVQAHEICREWGFEPKTILTWVKPQIGMGWYFRNNTEHVVFAVKGKMRLNVRNQPTAFTAKRLKHSQKPDLFYEIVEKCSPGPYLELFARRSRVGWTHWGNEAPVVNTAIPVYSFLPNIISLDAAETSCQGFDALL